MIRQLLDDEDDNCLTRNENKIMPMMCNISITNTWIQISFDEKIIMNPLISV